MYDELLCGSLILLLTLQIIYSKHQAVKRTWYSIGCLYTSLTKVHFLKTYSSECWVFNMLNQTPKPTSYLSIRLTWATNWHFVMQCLSLSCQCSRLMLVRDTVFTCPYNFRFLSHFSSITNIVLFVAFGLYKSQWEEVSSITAASLVAVLLSKWEGKLFCAVIENLFVVKSTIYTIWAVEK